eukprot:scaffold539823_cov18-Prasinocladus_malaysianus.AAC.2
MTCSPVPATDNGMMRCIGSSYVTIASGSVPKHSDGLRSIQLTMKRILRITVHYSQETLRGGSLLCGSK